MRLFSIMMLGFLGPLYGQDVASGWLNVVWGDSQPGIEFETFVLYSLTMEDGRQMKLDLSDDLIAASGGIEVINSRFITVSGVLSNDVLVAEGILYELDPAERGGAVSGPQPWISIPVKFADIATEPQSQSFFSNMYGGSPGQLDHYWREQSYDIINVVGSQAEGWRTLPQNQTFYVPTPGSGSNANLNALFDDAIATHDPFVDFSNGGTGGFQGINIMFNGNLDCCAWGGGRFATIDGVSKSWRVTWEPPWGYADEGVIAHEMGHGFGLPHSNNSDMDSSPYDSPWDVMSAATGHAVTDPTFGRLGKHTISYHKDRLEWIAPTEKILATAPGIYQVTIDQLALASTPNLRMVRIPIQGSATHYYTVEVRDQVGNYDGNLPGNAVIIHEVMVGRTEPAWVIDGDPIPATYSNTEGVMWRVGETFEDAANNITVRVDSATADGFLVTISHLNCSVSAYQLALPEWSISLDVTDLIDLLNCL